jgi:phenylalanyl-tRNA synthetase beta chain
MLNNSITHSANYSDEELKLAVRMLNNLSAELDTLRLSMLETGLQTVARNLNHRNDNLKLFEFGRTYSKHEGKYSEEDHLALFVTGIVADGSWNKKEEAADLYYVKGILQSLQKQSAIGEIIFESVTHPRYDFLLEGKVDGVHVASIGKPSDGLMRKFDIKSNVIFLDIRWSNWVTASLSKNLKYKEISKFPAVQRDLSFVLDRKVAYAEIEEMILSIGIKSMKTFRLFDIFESDKLGKDKRSMAMNFTFQDETKTLKDEEIDQWMGKITRNIETKLQAEIRK